MAAAFRSGGSTVCRSSLRIPHRSQVFLQRTKTTSSNFTTTASAKAVLGTSNHSKTRRQILGALWTGSAVGLGWWAAKADTSQQHRTLPAGTPRTCCEGNGPPLTTEQQVLGKKLIAITSAENVDLNVVVHGQRLKKGQALAVVRPETLQQAVDVLQCCVDANVCVIPQGANTGLTGGAVPRDENNAGEGGRPTVVVNMRKLKTIQAIDDGKLMVCLAGAGIYDLQQKVAEFGAESHSVLGSIFLNPSVAAGLALGSGGTQSRKGPVYSERILYARVTAEGKVEVVNTLGLMSGADHEHVFEKLQSGSVTPVDLDADCSLAAHNTTYTHNLCDINQNVARCNADTSGPDPVRSEGKVLILASVHATFPKPKQSKMLWVSTKNFETTQKLKYQVCLDNAVDVPATCEYMDRNAFDAINDAGRLHCFTIKLVGVGPMLSKLWEWKQTIEGIPLPFFSTISDRFLYLVNDVVPKPLSPEIMKLGLERDHHMIVSVGDFGNGEMERFTRRLDEFCKTEDVIVHECSTAEVQDVLFFRFAAAPAFRTWCVGKGLEGISVDYALPKNGEDIPLMVDSELALRMRYSHFACNVFHEDIAFVPGVNPHDSKMKLKKTVEAMHGKLPAEHGHGTEYAATPEQQQRWKAMDPLNIMNPGVGGLSGKRNYTNPSENN